MPRRLPVTPALMTNPKDGRIKPGEVRNPKGIGGPKRKPLMSDIPADIAKKAEELVRQDSCSSSTCTFMHGCGCFQAIAAALAEVQSAERERCARLCTGWLSIFEGHSIDHVSAGRYAADAVKDILEGIRAAKE